MLLSFLEGRPLTDRLPLHSGHVLPEGWLMYSP